MMTEAGDLAASLGVGKMPMSIDERIAAARSTGAHKMSMLQDLERGRPLETEILLDSIEAMKELARLPTPTIDCVYALLRLRSQRHQSRP
jgi:2-dehydropantoate 2-reductase